jgi:DNA-binding MarR family transcriptional regulator
MTEAQKNTMKRAMAITKPFHKLRETMPLQYITTFLHVASDEGQNVTEYARRAGTSQSLMSRHLGDLGEVNRYHEEGFGLIEEYTDGMDRRNSLRRLTDKGRGVVKEICDAFGR